MTKRFFLGAAKIGLGLAVAVFFLRLILQHLDLAELRGALAAARPGWIAAAVGVLLAGYACRISRWQMMLRRDNPHLRWTTCAVPFMGAMAANNVLPFRAGDALRALAFGRWLDVANPAVIATLLVERLLDLLSLLIALGLALIFFDLGAGATGTLVGVSGTALVGIGLAVMGLLLFPQVMQPVARIVLRAITGVSAGLGARLGAISNRIFATLRHLAQGSRMVLLVLWSAAVWGLEGAAFWVAALALPAITDASASFLALPVGTLATLLPSTPGYVGTFDFFVIKAMETVQNEPVAAAAFAVLIHLILWLPITLIGGACMAVWALRRNFAPRPAINESPSS